MGEKNGGYNFFVKLQIFMREKPSKKVESIVTKKSRETKPIKQKIIK
jgi:hypothetical protein